MQFLITLALQILMVAGLLKWVLPSVSRNRVALASNDGGSVFLGALSIVGFQTLFSTIYSFIIAALAVVLVGGTSLSMLFSGIDVTTLSVTGAVAMLAIFAAAVAGAFLTYMAAIRAAGRFFPQAVRVTASWGQTFIPALIIMLGNFVVALVLNQVFPVA